MITAIFIITTILMSFVFQGIINRTKAVANGRKGAGFLQPMKDNIRLLRKGSVISPTTSWVFQVSPTLNLASLICILLIIPFNNQPGLLSFEGDILFLTFLLALGKFWMVLAAFDTGSSFEGMGAAREALFSLLIEPAFFVVMGSLAILSNQTSLYGIYSNLHLGTGISYFIVAIVAYVLFQIALVENSRLPYDDPKTHLELTMIHEVMVLDYSGFDLGLIQYSTALKFVIFGGLIAGLFHLPSQYWIYNLMMLIGIQIIFAAAVGLLESFRARLKMLQNTQAIFMLTVIAVLVFLGVMILTNRLGYIHY